MTFQLDDRWTWDFWIVSDREAFHLFYLNAPRSLGDPHLRHRNATIGHASSLDLRNWTMHEPAIGPGGADAFDETATWTGSVIHDGDEWRLFYTGSRFVHPTEHRNIQTIGVADSADLYDWSKQPGPILQADPTWYETLHTGTWHEEAWRDPWVFRGPDGWHMLLTARLHPTLHAGPDTRDTGVVGHAFSEDLVHWKIREPLSGADCGFAHLEVLQTFALGSRDFVMFSCDSAHLAGHRKGEMGGIWVAPRDSRTGWCAIEHARLLTDESMYAGRIVSTPDGDQVLLAFENTSSTGEFQGRLTDPIPLLTDSDGWPATATHSRGAQL